MNKIKPVDGSTHCVFVTKGPSTHRSRYAAGSYRGPIKGSLTIDNGAIVLDVVASEGTIKISLVGPTNPPGVVSASTATAIPMELLRVQVEPQIVATKVEMQETYAKPKHDTVRYLILTRSYRYNILNTHGVIVHSVIRDIKTTIYTTSVREPKKFRSFLRRINRKYGLQIPLGLDPLAGVWASQ